jgi:hypothetical protein
MKKHVVAIIFYFSSFSLYAQNELVKTCVSIKDTVYLVSISGFFDDGYPKNNYFVAKNIRLLKSVNINNDTLLLKDLFANCVHLAEPFMGFERQMWKCNAKNKYDSLYKAFGKPYAIMNKKYAEIGDVKLKNKKQISFEAVKIIADFWLLDKDIKQINAINHSFYIENEWYKASYFLILKQVFESCRLSKQEKIELQNYLSITK